VDSATKQNGSPDQKCSIPMTINYQLSEQADDQGGG